MKNTTVGKATAQTSKGPTTTSQSRPSTNTSSKAGASNPYWDLKSYSQGKQNTKEFKDSFLKKIQFCCQSFDLNDETKDAKEKVNLLRAPNNSIEWET